MSHSIYSFRDLSGKRIELTDINKFGIIVSVTPTSFFYITLDNGENIYIDPLEKKYIIH